MTGTDEHGQKIQRSAAARGIPTQQFCDEVERGRNIYILFFKRVLVFILGSVGMS
jgi:methionyl-tRNA synthetase